jgi:hypothetical protein
MGTVTTVTPSSGSVSVIFAACRRRALLSVLLVVILGHHGALGHDNVSPVTKTTELLVNDDACLSAMKGLCNRTFTSKCMQCAAAYHTQLAAAGCNNQEVEDVCSKAMLATVTFHVQAPATNYGSVVVWTYSDYEGGGSKSASANGFNITMSQSPDPNDRYMIGAAGPRSYGQGVLSAAQFILRMWFEINAGPISTDVIVHWSNYDMSGLGDQGGFDNFGNLTGRSATPGGGMDEGTDDKTSTGSNAGDTIVLTSSTWLSDDSDCPSLNRATPCGWEVTLVGVNV